jgi:hypothetical protein
MKDMKTTRTTKTLAALHAMLLAEEANLKTWRRNGIPTAQKEKEIAGIKEQIKRLEG